MMADIREQIDRGACLLCEGGIPRSALGRHHGQGPCRGRVLAM